VKPYICPSDATNTDGRAGPDNWATTSYAYNYQVFAIYEGPPPAHTDWGAWTTVQGAPGRYPAAIQDGTSNTIFFTEKYGEPCADGWACDWGGNTWWEWAPKFAASITGPDSKFLNKPTVAYCDSNKAPDVIQDGAPLRNICSLMATSPHSSGINAAMGDGSVRFISAGVSGNTWWSAVTPRGGEVLGNDW
jgi:prepilin-type processing-associated H-X9-DG protein